MRTAKSGQWRQPRRWSTTVEYPYIPGACLGL